MKRIHLFAIVAIVATGITSLAYHNANASHGFEVGANPGALPPAVTVALAGQVMKPGDFLPLVDYSPNFVAGHLLVRIPCDNNAKPLVTPVAGHIDEKASRTWVAVAQLNYIEHASTPGQTCVYHSHVPAVDLVDVGNPGAPRITDIGLLNQGTSNVVFRTGNAMSFTLLRVIGEINPPNNYGEGGFAPASGAASIYKTAPTFPPVNQASPSIPFDHDHDH
ncbi:MAG: hypothetical protein QXG67_04045 [Candidatus Nitrosotenuis sp.]